MIVIVDNGKGAEEIANFVRQKTMIVDPKKATTVKGEAYILSDGDVKHSAENIKLVKSSKVPVLGVGAGSLFVASAFGSKIAKGTAKKKKKVSLKKACPLTLDMKRFFLVSSDCDHIVSELTPNFGVVASSAENENEIFQEFENPLFGCHFSYNSPEGVMIIRNFIKFLEVWEKYHK